MFDNKNLLITGGTGSFGNAVLKRFLETDIRQIRIFSRDEKKQDDMRKLFNSTKVKFYIGDVRDRDSLNSAMEGVDYVFHAAALKQVPSCEFYPLEAVKTNVLGTENVLNTAISHGIKKVVCLSTDKAVYPINTMGMSKALMEKVAVAKSRITSNPIITCTRYGNVMASRGSVIPLFISQILANEALTITDPNMTRFMMSLDDAVNLVLFAFENGVSGDIFVQKSPACTIRQIAYALKSMFMSEVPVKMIGTRHGEKKFESLLTKEEFSKAVDLGNYYRIRPDDRDLNYDKYFSEGDLEIASNEDYTSDNTYQLTDEELIALLSSLPEVRAELKRKGCSQ